MRNDTREQKVANLAAAINALAVESMNEELVLENIIIPMATLVEILDDLRSELATYGIHDVELHTRGAQSWLVASNPHYEKKQLEVARNLARDIDAVASLSTESMVAVPVPFVHSTVVPMLRNNLRKMGWRSGKYTADREYGYTWEVFPL